MTQAERIVRRASRSSNRHHIEVLLKLAGELKGKPMSKLDDACRALVTAQSGADDWDALDDELKDQIRGEIRAVFQAVREPSEDMVGAGIKQADECTAEWTASSACVSIHSWQAMIDALVSE